MVFHRSLSDRKSPQVSRTLLSILTILNNAVVWLVSTRPPTSKSSGPFSNPLVTVPKAPFTIGIIVTCMFHSFFNSRERFYFFSSFDSSVIRWFLRGVWVTTSHLTSPGLSSIFWPISASVFWRGCRVSCVGVRKIL